MIRRIAQRGWRQLVLLAAMLAFSGYVAKHLVYWQITEHKYIAHAAAQIFDSETNIPAARGWIYDSTGAVLVSDMPAYQIAADPIVIGAPRYYAAKLARILRRDPGPILARLQHKPYQWVMIAPQVNQAQRDAIKKLGLPGLIISDTYRAYNPQGPLASPVLGFVNAGGVGQYGLEQNYNTWLTGRDGSQLVFVDTSNHPLPVGVQKPRPAIPGDSLVLTINATIQAIVEQRLAAALQRYRAVSGSAIVMDPHSGAIMAMASLPSFDPNRYGQYNPVSDANLFINNAIQNYQPGSTFKLVSVASGLDYGAFTPATRVWDPGYYVQYGMTVHNWDNGGGWGWETPETMLRHSANVGMSQFVNMIKPPTAFYDYVTNHFGFNAPTGIDLPENEYGYVRTPTNGRLWSLMDLLTNSYGQGIDVTPLQLITAVGAIANNGWRVQPYMVQRIVSADGHTVWTAHPHRVARAISAATAATMTRIVQGSAYEGEATCALTTDYPVAAKTGTATIEGPGAHGPQLNSGTVASLIGWAPANNPRFIMLIVIRHPQPGPGGQNIWGSVVAAPAWHDIALKLYRLLNIPPQPGSTPPDLATQQGPTGWNCAFMPQQ